jgi:CxxC motif-containing protein (DUF1111 family)
MKLLPATCIAAALTAAAFATPGSKAASPSLRDFLMSIPETAALGGTGTRALTNGDAFSFQMANSPENHERPFSFGNRLFNTNWVEAPASVKSFDGLGPLFNRVSCAGCHTKDGRGAPPADGNGPMDSLLLRVSIPGVGPHGGPLPDPAYGDQISEHGILHVPSEATAHITYTEQAGTYSDGEKFSLRVPSYTIEKPAYGPLNPALMISPRVAPQMIGLGLLEAVPEKTILALADSDGVSGRPNHVWNSSTQKMELGRFGWKANQPNLRQQNAGAAIGDIGLSTSVNHNQNCTPAQTECQNSINGGEPEVSDVFLDKLTLYTETLAVPAQRNSDKSDVKAGAKIFRTLGCAACHMPTLQTGDVAAFPELANQTIHPYTDLLLHDMGEALADHRPDFEATGTEWRTPPLWGLGLVPTVNGHNTLLHDGRARGFEEAILWHGGEAEKARENFRMSSKDVREKLIAFLSSL